MLITKAKLSEGRTSQQSVPGTSSLDYPMNLQAINKRQNYNQQNIRDAT